MTNELVKNNSEILFLFDAKNCNPNGDMDNENKPRMDFDTSTNLVSDVRIKRYLRDFIERNPKYMAEKYGITEVANSNIFVTDKTDAKTSDKRAEQIFKAITNKTKMTSKDKTEIVNSLKKLVDIRLFGGIATISKITANLTGPIQFNWGYSLNKVELLESKTITSHFATGKGGEGAGIGKDYRVKYSFIAINGSVNHNLGEIVGLTLNDIKLFDEAMIKSIPFNRTRSKIGQTPRLYLRVIMKNGKTLNDLREFVSLKKTENLNTIFDVELDISRLEEYLEDNKNSINKIIVWRDKNLKGNFNPEGIKIENLTSL